MKVPAALLTLVAAAAVLQPGSLHAQKTNLDVTGFPVNFATPTAADFIAGEIVSPTIVQFTVDAQTGVNTQRTTIVSIRCAAPCPTTGTKSASTLKWQRVGTGIWYDLSTSDVEIERRFVFRGQPLPASNDPWTGQIQFKATLDWIADQESAITNTYSIIMTLTVTVP